VQDSLGRVETSRSRCCSTSGQNLGGIMPLAIFIFLSYCLPIKIFIAVEMCSPRIAIKIHSTNTEVWMTCHFGRQHVQVLNLLSIG
jgi:hypothetical protein